MYVLSVQLSTNLPTSTFAFYLIDEFNKKKETKIKLVFQTHASSKRNIPTRSVFHHLLLIYRKTKATFTHNIVYLSCSNYFSGCVYITLLPWCCILWSPRPSANAFDSVEIVHLSVR